MNKHLARVTLQIGLAIGAASMSVPALTPTATASASGIDLGAVMGKALAHAQSFEVVTDSTSTHASASPGGVMKMHITEIFIHRGSSFALSMQTMIDGKVNDVVYTGKHVCVKQGATGAWNCHLPLSYAKGYLDNMDPVKALKASGATMTGVASVGTRTIAGQQCTGYRYATSLASIHYQGTGTLWFSLATGRVVQGTSSGTTTIVPGNPPMVISGTSTFSRWNDPSLNLPTVPVS
jgi:hypothetical protein